jgi:hypothetical protein
MKSKIAIIISLLVIVYLLLRKAKNNYVIQSGSNIDLGTREYPVFNIDGLTYDGADFVSNIIQSIVPKRNAMRWTSDGFCGCDKKTPVISGASINRIIEQQAVVNCGPRRWIDNTNRNRNGINAKKVFWNQCEDLEDERRFGKYAVN